MEAHPHVARGPDGYPLSEHDQRYRMAAAKGPGSDGEPGRKTVTPLGALPES
jgi:hypothetical protein